MHIHVSEQSNIDDGSKKSDVESSEERSESQKKYNSLKKIKTYLFNQYLCKLLQDKTHEKFTFRRQKFLDCVSPFKNNDQ